MITLCKIASNIRKSSRLYVQGNLIRKRHSTSDNLNVNTNVAKDVILFKYDNPRFFKILNVFAICQFGFWGYLSHFAFTKLRDVPVPEDGSLPWWRKFNLGENKYRNTIAIFSFLVGKV